jgi:hypothetical protein
MTNDGEIVGRGRDHSEAYDEFAKKLVIAEAQRRGFSKEPDRWSEEELAELQEHFEGMEIETRVAIEVLPHNQWVKTFSVKQGGPSG